jgi:hypothetical protein
MEGSIIEYPRRIATQNSNFNIQKIQLRHKRQNQPIRIRELCRNIMKSEAKT